MFKHGVPFRNMGQLKKERQKIQKEQQIQNVMNYQYIGVR